MDMNHHAAIDGGMMTPPMPPPSSHSSMAHMLMTPPTLSPPSSSLQNNNLAHMITTPPISLPLPLPPPSSSSSYNATMAHHRKMMMHMTFYWGKDAEILFAGWPGSNIVMYVLSIFAVFLLAILVEWLSYSQLATAASNAFVSTMLLTLQHALRMGLGYLIMLSIMSFNGGIFIAVIAGHAIGFLVFGAQVFAPPQRVAEDPDPNSSDLPSMKC